MITFLLTIVVGTSSTEPHPVSDSCGSPAAWRCGTARSDYLMFQTPFRPRARWQAPAQIIGDLAIITAVVYETGAQDSYFISLYLLAILMGSILFSRRGAFCWPERSFVLLGCMIELMFYGVIPRTTHIGRRPARPGVLAVEAIFSLSLLWRTWGACWRRRIAQRR